MKQIERQGWTFYELSILKTFQKPSYQVNDMLENIKNLSIRHLFHYNLGTVTKFVLFAMFSKYFRKNIF